MGTHTEGIKDMTSILNFEEYIFRIREGEEDPSYDHNLDLKMFIEYMIISLLMVEFLLM